MSRKAIKEKAQLAIRAAMNDDASVPEKASAARNLAQVILEMCDELGPKKAARLFRSLMETEAALRPSTHEVTIEELVEVAMEMERQNQRLN